MCIRDRKNGYTVNLKDSVVASRKSCVTVKDFWTYVESSGMLAVLGLSLIHISEPTRLDVI
eukprot:5378509-Prorocentrum_lima.AAC.1